MAGSTGGMGKLLVIVFIILEIMKLPSKILNIRSSMYFSLEKEFNNIPVLDNYIINKNI